jgi:ankyrin repeat protein
MNIFCVLYIFQSGYTSLHIACHCGHKEIAVTLIDRGADIHMKNNVRINNYFN